MNWNSMYIIHIVTQNIVISVEWQGLNDNQQRRQKDKEVNMVTIHPISE